MNSPNTSINDSILIHEHLDNVGVYIFNTLIEYCIETGLTHKGAGGGNSTYGIYENFSFTITRKISNTIEHFFKSGLYKEQKNFPIKTEILMPRNSTLNKIEDNLLDGILRFSIETHLTPRYLKDGDAGKYTFIFEIQIGPIRDGERIERTHNAEILDGSNRSYKVAIIYPNKTEPLTVGRDESIQRSRDAYRKALMRVVKSGTFSNK